MLAVLFLGLLGMPVALAQVALESVVNGTGGVAGSGPTTNGPAAGDQVVTLRHNTNNPAGNAMVARTPAIDVTYRLTSQQYTGLTDAQGYTANTGRNAVFFGGGASSSPTITPSAGVIYQNLSGLGSASASHLTSVSPAAAGQGIDLVANAGVRLVVSTDAIATRAPVPATSSRVRMADLEIRFSAAVDNPILHFAGLGAVTGSPNGVTPLSISAEFDVMTPGVTLTRLSGNSALVLSGNQINNGAANPGASCATGVGACGSVRVNGTGLTVVTLRVYLRGNGAYSSWNGNGDDFNGDGLLIGVSVVEPTPTVTVRKISNGGAGTFNFTGTNGYAATAVTTAVAGTPVNGTTRTLGTVGASTDITEATTPGYRLTGVSCTGLGSGGTATVSGLSAGGVAGGGTVRLSAAATTFNSDIVCTFTNEKLPILRLRKSLPNGRVQATDQFSLSMTGPNAPTAITTTGSGSTATGILTHAGATTGSLYTLAEGAAGTTVLAQYDSTYTCTNARAGGQTPSGTGVSFGITPVAGDDLTCTFANAARLADVSILKTASDPVRLPGQAVQFTLLVSNAGAAAANGTQVRDPVAAGLDCTALSCTAAGAAACPVSPTVAGLQAAPGLTIPTLPAGGSISLLLTCTVTASGFTP
ncbi:DUF11 domain-containing protein [Pseudoxanthomonas sp. LH2527]|uniref:DUF11 domain-containing protein n=1 Tax=Pseudoxanthomonas sp. LH2527 TaxID=2923249 RepID=UPI001F135420|nr:DUF11 domain-containing protein [Pseudoxanthomonas sp. LH2527]